MRGKVYTFYSYKGGVGRSMAMANVAALLSLWGKKVLVIDWDLEAPGLENYYKEGNESLINDLGKKEGLINLLLRRKNNSEYTIAENQWREIITPIPIKTKNEKLKVFVDILTAGRKNDSYIQRVRELDYASFYEDNKGGDFLEELREYWVSKYDYVLIDSRTGLTDSGGVCSIQMPDALVMLFTATDLGYKGSLEIASRAIQAQKSIIYDRYALKILPVPTRFDSTEFQLQKDWLARFELGLKPLYSTWVSEYASNDKISIDQRKILELTKLPYIPYFSYGEKLAVIEQGTADPQGLGYAIETLSAVLYHDLEGAKLLTENRSEYVRRAKSGESPDEVIHKPSPAESPIQKANNKYKWLIGSLITLVILGVLFVNYFKIGQVELTNNIDKQDLQKLEKENKTYLLNAAQNAVESNNISSIIDINKQFYARRFNESQDTLTQQIFKSIKDKLIEEVRFRLPKVYAEIKTFDESKSMNDQKSVNKKDSISYGLSPDKIINPIQKYFSDPVIQFGPFKMISNACLQNKLNNKILIGFSNHIEGDSVNIIAMDSSGILIRYNEIGNYTYEDNKDTILDKSKNDFCTPITLHMNPDLKIDQLMYEIKEEIVPVNLKPILKPKAILIKTRVEIFTSGDKINSRLLLQANAIFELLLNYPEYLPHLSIKSSETIKDKNQNQIIQISYKGIPSSSNNSSSMVYSSKDLLRAQNLRDIILKKLNINLILKEAAVAPGYINIYLIGVTEVNKSKL